MEDDPGMREGGCGPVNPALTWKGAEQRQMISHTPARDMPPMIGSHSLQGQKTQDKDITQSVLPLSEGAYLHSPQQI